MGVTTDTAADRVQRTGVKSATSIDLLAIVLARNEDDVVACEADAQKLLKRLKPERLADLAPADLRDSSGLERFEVVQRQAAFEIGRRSSEAGRGERPDLSDAQSVVDLFEWLKDEPQERFCAAFLDSKNRVISTRTIHIGTVNSSMVGPREVFREAIRENAASLIVVHNHPSGDTEPSPEDITVTKKLVEVGKLLDILLLDHIIIGSDGYTSLSELGHL